ncbi:hypothetical protein [Cohnella nanjingensis]|uniref:Signal peptide protein n=1 Tax=Cohnella nanjingensis TaxID=1387779 RepID=A0A7X0VI63_9BACL|nr:hypothetical protein [Cohnella nanjingensis]MBB6673344.1 signal peptide protein [Cohnella nanjingensis]
MSNYGYEGRPPQQGPSSAARIVPVIVIGILFAIVFGIIANACSKHDGSSSLSWSGGAERGESAESSDTVPWDYQLTEATVGDLIGGDMTLLPGNELMPNDDNYGTGDKIWVLEYMGAVMKTSADNRTDVTLTAWKPIKSYKTKTAADADIGELKLNLKTEVDLIGVYKTTYQGKTREFAVLQLPSGQTVKQPIDDDRYAKLKPLKKVGVVLEEVHDYSQYDLAYAKFRGWAA